MIPDNFLKMKIGDIKKINFQNNQKYFQEKTYENNPLKNIGSNSEDFLNENNLNLSFNNINNNLNNLKSDTNQNKFENLSFKKKGNFSIKILILFQNLLMKQILF